jgi:hypothetical protein
VHLARVVNTSVDLKREDLFSKDSNKLKFSKNTKIQVKNFIYSSKLRNKNYFRDYC